ncbi:unnamed protein product [Lactuca saligna]|uniref:Transposase, Ptta/En/Spm, plant n=1 Tax=Lactuca saligna TaxID=75948 RepID=A0AA36E1L6_LACSI|nr:unnamed protein product [Lactuca saligna]
MSIVIGVAGSNSQGAINEQTDMADPLADLAGILRHQARGLGHMSQLIQTDYRLQSPKWVIRLSFQIQMHRQNFGRHRPRTRHGHQTRHRRHMAPPLEVLRAATTRMRVIFRSLRCPSSAEKGESLGLGKSTARVLVSIGRIWIIRGPDLVIFPMRPFCRCFRTMYKWNSLENSNIFDAFKCVLKDRYRDRMKHIRIKSGEMARNDGKPVPLGHCTYYEGMHDYRPERVPENHWSTDKWRKNSKIAQQNRKVADANGSTARHTAGSIGFDEHRNNLEKVLGKPPTQFDVFMKTHGTAEAKKRYFAGDHENLEYCSLTAKEAQEMYLQEMAKKHGEDSSNHKDDARVWEEIQLRRKGKKKGDIYGIGASDIHFVITGTPSSQSTQSDSTQQEVDRLRAQVSTMEQQQQQMKEQMEMVMRMMNMSGNQPRAPPDNPPEDN